MPYQFWEVVIVRLSIAVGAVAGATPAVTASHVHVVLASVPAWKIIIINCDWHIQWGSKYREYLNISSYFKWFGIQMVGLSAMSYELDQRFEY